MEGFSRELATRLESVKSVRVELESLYSKRVEDSAIDQPDNSDFKERCMVALRNAESAFTNYAGTVRSIKSVVDTWYQINFFDLRLQKCTVVYMLFCL